MKISIICNGEPREIEDGTSVAQLIYACGLKSATVAVEYDGRVLAPAAYESTFPAAGSRLELIRFVGGGSGC